MAYRDKRPVDELSIEELERVLAIRRREEREKKLERMKRAGRIVASDPIPQPNVLPAAVSQIPNIPGVTTPAQPDFPPTPLTAQPALQVASVPITGSPRFEDDRELAIQAAEKSHFWKSFLNQSLLFVEALAVIGLLFLGYEMITATNTLQRETASAQALANQQREASLPTLQPTPQIQLNSVVLPGGHTFDANGQVQFNYSEIPEALRSMVSDQIFVPISARPQPTTETAVALSIPRLDINQTIVQGTDWEALKLGIGQLLNGVNPGDPTGNLVLSGHNDIYGEVFRYIDQLQVGDEFTVRTRTQSFTYRVTGSDIVSPNDVYVLNERGGATATLISCYPYKVNDKRYIVYAERISNGV